MEFEIAKQVTETLGPYLKPLLDKGKAALEKTIAKKIGDLWDQLGGMITSRPEAKAAAEKLAANPTDEQARLLFADEMSKIIEFMPNLVAELKPILAQSGEVSDNTINANNSAVALGSNASAASDGSAIVHGDVKGDLNLGK